MTMHSPVATGELVEDFQQFFAPVDHDVIDHLVGEYRAMRLRVEALAEAVNGEQYRGAIPYFIEGNLRDERHSLPTRIDRLFQLDGAIAQLNATYWDKALRMTDVLDVMPQKRRDEWFEQIRNPQGLEDWTYEDGKRVKRMKVPPIPEFTEESVRATLGDLLLSRAKFFAERVEGTFRALSKDHVTNQPQGFGKRMIIPRAISAYGTIEHSTSGVINDLRCVIARFMGRDEPHYGDTDGIIRIVRKRNGEWHNIDGGALRIRVYNGVGTAHLEVHPDMAWRLNAVLASLYPAAIPESFRTKPKRRAKVKDFELFDRPLPTKVVSLLAGMKPMHVRIGNDAWDRPRFSDIPNTMRFDYGEHDKYALAEAERVLAAIGGVPDSQGRFDFWRFDYDPREVLDQIICSGCIPDHKSHQFYPTPASVAAVAVEQAMVGAKPGMRWLEPSAGVGGLADRMPKEALCVEISPLHCRVLEAKGHDVVEADFLKFVSPEGFDRVVMNPPFSDGRWMLHVEHAAQMLKPGGRLVAILPASAKGKDILPGWTCRWSPVFDNEFAGTSVSVVIFTADKLSC